jgi:hypothetical protein
MTNNPSIKTIKNGLKVSDDIAETIKDLFDGNIDVKEFRSFWSDTPYIDNYTNEDKILCVINNLINGYGVEVIRGQYVDNYYQDINLGYVNLGDTYTTTVIRDYLKQSWIISSWGNIVESNYKRFEV